MQSSGVSTRKEVSVTRGDAHKKSPYTFVGIIASMAKQNIGLASAPSRSG